MARDGATGAGLTETDTPAPVFSFKPCPGFCFHSNCTFAKAIPILERELADRFEGVPLTEDEKAHHREMLRIARQVLANPITRIRS